MAADLWDTSVPSAGLTLDTILGPVDLVAVRRALHGETVELTVAELVFLLDHLGTEHDRVAPVARALGRHPDSVAERVRRRRPAPWRTTRVPDFAGATGGQ